MTNRLDLDKYYTDIDLANYCFDKVVSIIGVNNISEIIEPSVGNGSFLHNKVKVDIGIDIAPEIDFDTTTKIICNDYLQEPFEYKRNRLIIGNPPYGRCLSLAQKFYKKSVSIADYIAFILPISQLNNSNSMYEFDLIYSEDLGSNIYTDRELHCCLNIYKRPLELNKKVVRKLKDITIYRQDSKNYNDAEYDLRMCYWGNGSAGKILSEDEHYSAEYKIKVNNEVLKEDIIRVLSNFDWATYLNCIAMRKIQQYHIVDILRKEIPSIQ